MLDLGTGAGFDCFLAARKVGPTGRVVGVDMTDAMLEKARANAGQDGPGQCRIPQGRNRGPTGRRQSVDVMISNCALNLVPEKTRLSARFTAC